MFSLYPLKPFFHPRCEMEKDSLVSLQFHLWLSDFFSPTLSSFAQILMSWASMATAACCTGWVQGRGRWPERACLWSSKPWGTLGSCYTPRDTAATASPWSWRRGGSSCCSEKVKISTEIPHLFCPVTFACSRTGAVQKSKTDAQSVSDWWDISCQDDATVVVSVVLDPGHSIPRRL